MIKLRIKDLRDKLNKSVQILSATTKLCLTVSASGTGNLCKNNNLIFHDLPGNNT